MRRLLMFLLMLSLVFAESKVWVTVSAQERNVTQFEDVSLNIDYSPVDSACSAYLDASKFTLSRGRNNLGNLSVGSHILNVTCDFRNYSASERREIVVSEKKLKLADAKIKCNSSMGSPSGQYILLPLAPVNLVCSFPSSALTFHALDLPFGTTELNLSGVLVSDELVFIDKKILGVAYDSFSIVPSKKYVSPLVSRCAEFDLKNKKCLSPAAVDSPVASFDPSTNKFTFTLSGAYVIKERPAAAPAEGKEESITGATTMMFSAFFLAILLFSLFIFLIRDKDKRGQSPLPDHYGEMDDEFTGEISKNQKEDDEPEESTEDRFKKPKDFGY